MGPYIFLVLAAIGISAIGTFVKLIDPSVHFMTINFYRLFLGFLFLAFTAPFIDKTTFNVKRKDLGEYFFVGIIYAITLSLFTTANVFAPVQNVILLNSLSPFFVLIFAYFLLHEKITAQKIIAIVIALVGLVILNPFSAGDYLLGNTLALLSAVFLALLITEMKKECKSHGIGTVMWYLFFGSLILSPSLLIFGAGDLLGNWQPIIALGVISTGITYLLMNLALKHVEAEAAAVITIVVAPLSAIIIAAIVVGEQIYPKTVLGGLFLILAGICAQTASKEKKACEIKGRQGAPSP